jgi:Lrp/AsnC family leucine-responsive transcriptional regulator
MAEHDGRGRGGDRSGDGERGGGRRAAGHRWDAVDRALLDILAVDGRIGWAPLGRRVGLSASAVAERVRRLEASGAIRSYAARLDPAAAGRPITAFVRLSCGSERHAALKAALADRPEILECHHVTGEDEILLKIGAPSVPALDRVLLALAPFGPTASSLVLDTWCEP